MTLAARSGSPVLPLHARNSDPASGCVAWDVSDPCACLRGVAADQFAHAAVKRLYENFEPLVAAEPEHWGHCHLFHRYRFPAQESANSADISSSHMRRRLTTGERFVKNVQRIVEVADEEGALWVDALTLRTYRIPRELADVTDALSANREGIGSEWLTGRETACAERDLECLATLAHYQAITSMVCGTSFEE